MSIIDSPLGSSQVSWHEMRAALRAAELPAPEERPSGPLCRDDGDHARLIAEAESRDVLKLIGWRVEALGGDLGAALASLQSRTIVPWPSNATSPVIAMLERASSSGVSPNAMHLLREVRYAPDFVRLRRDHVEGRLFLPDVRRAGAFWTGMGERQWLWLYVLMEHTGPNLRGFMQSPPKLPLGERLRFLMGLARGLAFLHAQSHLQLFMPDLKPENVTWPAKGKLDGGLLGPKVIDLGSFYAPNALQSDRTNIPTTKNYSVPDPTAGKPVAADDVYRFGLVAHELISGRSARKDEETGFHSSAESLQASLRPLLDACFAPRASRPADGAVLVERFEACLRAAGHSAVVDEARTELEAARQAFALERESRLAVESDRGRAATLRETIASRARPLVAKAVATAQQSWTAAQAGRVEEAVARARTAWQREREAEMVRLHEQVARLAAAVDEHVAAEAAAWPSADELRGYAEDAESAEPPWHWPTYTEVVVKASSDAEASAEPPSAARSSRRATPGAGVAAELAVPSRLPAGITQGDRAGEFVNTKDDSVLVWVPPGTFRMGSDSGRPDERPVHEVRLTRGYFLGKYPVTWGQYRKFCQETQRTTPSKPSFSHDGQHPVVNVSLEDAVDYCTWATLGLPTEAEWEFAARGTEGRTYPWGDQEPDPTRAVFGRNGTATVGSCSAGASPFGAQDMAGNVWEWCQDGYEPYAAGLVVDPCAPGMLLSLGSSAYADGGLVVDPYAPNGTRAVLRGGSWGCGSSSCRGARRGWSAPSRRRDYIGFRVARSSED